jgi:gamma-glutamylcyclotransferase (GGCT)/AIG2-like uncharacterized protein YtfP
MNDKLFVYGTLMIPEIREAMLQRKVNYKDAILEGYTANTIIYGHYTTEYPFLKPGKGEKVKGGILYPVNSRDISLIKYYEGSEYICTNITVLSDNKEIETLAFLHNEKCNIEYGPEWDYDSFVCEYLHSYITEIIPQVLRNYHM